MPEQEVIEPQPEVSFALPPKWTETRTPTVTPAPTSTPEATMTPTLTFALTPLPSGILARPATDEEVDAGNSIWNLTHFAEVTAPGVKRYSVDITSTSAWMWDCYFCAQDKAYPSYIDSIRVRFLVDGQSLPEGSLRVFDGKGAEGWQCRTWATMLSGWPPESTVNLEIRSTFKQAVSDGRSEYPAGEYRQIINVAVEP
jgi:hypothetical protein